MCVYLHAKFEVSSIILTSFRQGDIFTPPPPQYELLKSSPRVKPQPVRARDNQSKLVRVTPKLFRASQKSIEREI